ncbi:unnamed protein product [Clonostachys byssicola]|uniref:NmrA-like domain-containing protein n=1 Tax=Clonostachys byssicola TaxID=160290 RepID=A0A9N9UCE8_9HYPO|nr:unnamed protein product [Clonostachys byssicola]
MSKLIVIVGITGKQGGSVADVFLQDPTWRVRGLTRDPSRDTAKEWISKGVDMVAGDQDDLESLKAAFAGADVIYGVTDFAPPMYDAESHKVAAQQGISINEFAHNLEVRRGKNLAIAAASIPTLGRYVYSTLSDARKLSKGKYVHVYHFDSKATVAEYIKTAKEMEDLARKTSFLQVGLYADNWKSGFPEIQKNADHSFYHVGLGDGHTKLPFIWARKDVGVLVKGLVSAEGGKMLLGYSQNISWRQFMEIWAETLNVPLADNAHHQISEEALEDLLPAFPEGVLTQEFSECFAYFEEFGYDGGDPNVIHPKDVDVAENLTPLKEYIKSEDWSKILQ